MKPNPFLTPIVDLDTASDDEIRSAFSLLATYNILGDFENRPIFTRKLIEFASQQLAEGGRLQDPYELVDLDGNKHPRDGPRYYVGADGGIFGSSPLGWLLICFSYIHIPKEYRHLIPSDKRTIPVGYAQPKYPHLCRCNEVSTETYKEWEAEWERSPYRRNLIMELEKHVRNSEEVKQIICFGNGPVAARHCYLQHLVACTVRRIMSENQTHSSELGQTASTVDDIKIYAQDPAYCGNCKSVLKDLNIEVVDDPKGLLLMDKNTFVISFAPDMPIWQLAVDILYDEGGPAGLLSDEIEDISDSKAIVPIANFWSPNVQAYKDRCIASEVIDSDVDEKRVVITERSGLYLKRKQHDGQMIPEIGVFPAI